MSRKARTATAASTPAERRAAARGPAVPPADVDRELRLGRIVGPLAILSILLSLVSAPVSVSGADYGHVKNDDVRELMQVGLLKSSQLAGIGMQIAGFLLLVPVALYLQWVIRARDASAPAWTPYVGIVGFVLIMIALPLGFHEVRPEALDFVRSGPRTGARAKHLLKQADTTVTDVLRVAGVVLFAIWIGLVAVAAQRVGLLSRFLGMFGIGAAGATLLGIGGIVVGQALFVGWMGSVAILMLGYWPGGRFPAWDEGRAVSWDEVDSRDAGTARRSAR